VVEITENVIELTKLRCANVKLMSRLPWWYDLRGGWFLGVLLWIGLSVVAANYAS
jgi:hypothetical protein